MMFRDDDQILLHSTSLSMQTALGIYTQKTGLTEREVPHSPPKTKDREGERTPLGEARKEPVERKDQR